MAEAAPTAAERKETLERGFQALVDYYFNKAKTEADKLLVVQAMNRSIRSFSLDAEPSYGVWCPLDWEVCPDGSCMPPGEC